MGATAGTVIGGCQFVVRQIDDANFDEYQQHWREETWEDDAF